MGRLDKKCIILWVKQYSHYLTVRWGDKVLHSFSLFVNPKVDIIKPLSLELTTMSQFDTLTTMLRGLSQQLINGEHVYYPRNRHCQIYIYIYIYVYLGSISSLMKISLNIIDILCLHILFWIRSNSRITFIVFGGNWFRYCPQLYVSLVLSARLWAIIRGESVTKVM